MARVLLNRNKGKAGVRVVGLGSQDFMVILDDSSEVKMWRCGSRSFALYHAKKWLSWV